MLSPFVSGHKMIINIYIYLYIKINDLALKDPTKTISVRDKDKIKETCSITILKIPFLKVFKNFDLPLNMKEGRSTPNATEMGKRFITTTFCIIHNVTLEVIVTMQI